MKTKNIMVLALALLAGCMSRSVQPTLFGNTGMGGGGRMGMFSGMGGIMPSSGGRFSIYGGSHLAGTGFDPRAADAIAINDAAREAERRATVPRVEYRPAATPPPTPSLGSARDRPQGGGETNGFATRNEFRPVVDELVNQNRRLRAVERRAR